MTGLKFSSINLFFLLLSVMFLSFFRASLLLLIPLIPFFLYIFFPFKVKFSFFLLYILSSIPVISGLINKTEGFLNSLFSLIITFSVLSLFLSSPSRSFPHLDTRQIWGKIKRRAFFILLVFLILNNLLGIFQYLYNPFNYSPRQDAFIGFYGRHGMAQHGLSILNGYVVLYFLGKLLEKERRFRKYEFILFLFFLISHILCFFELGMLILLMTVAFFFLFRNFSLKRVFYFLLIVFVVFLLFEYFFPHEFIYLTNNLFFIYDLIYYKEIEIDFIPGKFSVWISYFKAINDNLFLLLFGLGPGSFNSRISFLLNIDSSNLIVSMFGHSMPALHEKIVHPLWDLSKVSMANFNDGTKNQPFSSFLAFLGEYGLIFSCVFIRVVFKEIKNYWYKIEDKGVKNFYYMGWIYTSILLLLDNFFEYSEFWVFIIFFFLLKIDVFVKSNTRYSSVIKK